MAFLVDMVARNIKKKRKSLGLFVKQGSQKLKSLGKGFLADMTAEKGGMHFGG